MDSGRSGAGRAGQGVGQGRTPTPSGKQPATPPVEERRATSRGGGGTARARRKQSNARFYAALAVLSLAGVGAIAYFATRPNEAAAVRTLDPNAPPPKAEGYLLGNPSAPVQIIEFADFECPACGQFATITAPDVKKRLVETGLASYRFYDFPLEMHRNSVPAHNAAACANEQGKFWPMHDRIFAGQGEWNGEATRNPKGIFEGYAKELGLNVDLWEDCYDARKYMPQIQANQAEGTRRQVGQTPTFIIGNKMYPGSLPYDAIKQYVQEAAAAKGVAVPPAGDSARGTQVPAGAAKK